MANTDDVTRLNDAISRASKEVLVNLTTLMCATNPSAREFFQGRLFVDEDEVPKPGSPYSTSPTEVDSEDETAPHPQTSSPKRSRMRFAVCINCKEEYDVSENTATSCSYHPELASPDYDGDHWADHDENCHGPIDTEENLESYPEGFIYECCDRSGDEEPCTIDWHREDDDYAKGFKKQRV